MNGFSTFYDIKLFDGRIPPRLPDCVDLRYIMSK